MSKCISRHGEYSEHILDADFTCTLCFAFDEDAVLAALNAAVGLLADAREALDTYADRIDPHVYDELASPLHDAPLDGEGNDMVATVIAGRRDSQPADEKPRS
jgi:hypothetical protein